MTNGTSTRFEISVSELDKLVDLGTKVLSGLTKASNFPKDQRQKVRDAVADTCELINSILTTVKQRVSDVRKAVLADDTRASNMIADLGSVSEWEDRYRQFQICEPLRNAAGDLRDGVLGRFVQYFSFRDKDDLRATVDRFLATEAAAGDFVGHLLDKLAGLGTELASNKQTVVDELGRARERIQAYRDQFVDLEKQLRSVI